MTSTLNTSNYLFFFLSYLKMIRVEVLEKFTIPILDVTYWEFIIGVAIASVVITVLVSGVRIGVVRGHVPRRSDSPKKGGSNE